VVIGLKDKVAHFRRLSFTNSVHILFTYCPYRPASGLRVETDSISDKEKSELNFCFVLKKILTKNSPRRSPAAQKYARGGDVDRALGIADDFASLREV